MIFFTADQHIGHSGIITMQHRPFSDVAEMNKTLIINYNASVNKNDTVYILGDICHHLSIEAANDIISQMHGKKILIRGNHDKMYDPDLFAEICDFKIISASGQTFVLMHYPMLSWPKMHAGSIQLHGHIHSHAGGYNMQTLFEGTRRYDVGVDANYFHPVSVEQILAFLKIT